MEKLKIDMYIEEDASILDKMKQLYLNCPEAIMTITKLGIPDKEVDDNITKIYDYVSDLNYCAKCPGISKCDKQNRLLCTKIVYKDGYVDRELVPCEKFLNQITFEKQFLIRDFEDEWLELGVKSFDSESAPRKRAMSKLSCFLNKGDNSWIYLTGGPNTGRSFTAAAFSVGIAKKQKGPICFINCSKRIRELYDLNFSDKEKFQRELDKLCYCKVLVLDDFGNEIKNDYVRDAIVFQILSIRASKKLFTIITSDFVIDDIVTLYSTSRAGEVRAKQIGKLIKALSGKEISLGELSIY